MSLALGQLSYSWREAADLLERCPACCAASSALPERPPSRPPLPRAPPAAPPAAPAGVPSGLALTIALASAGALLCLVCVGCCLCLWLHTTDLWACCRRKRGDGEWAARQSVAV